MDMDATPDSCATYDCTHLPEWLSNSLISPSWWAVIVVERVGWLMILLICVLLVLSVDDLKSKEWGQSKHASSKSLLQQGGRKTVPKVALLAIVSRIALVSASKTLTTLFLYAATKILPLPQHELVGDSNSVEDVDTALLGPWYQNVDFKWAFDNVTSHNFKDPSAEQDSKSGDVMCGWTCQTASLWPISVWILLEVSRFVKTQKCVD